MREAKRDGSDRGDRCTVTGFVLPLFGIVMKVGPHTGMSLSEIINSKYSEESRNGIHYWGYSGTLCHPKRVLEFMSYVLSLQTTPPDLLLLETSSRYNSPIGKIQRFSRDNDIYKDFNGPVQLQGAQYAFVCRNLRRMNYAFTLDSYSVVGGKSDGESLSRYLRHRVNKAFVRRNHMPASHHQSRLAYTAQFVAPYVLWLGT